MKVLFINPNPSYASGINEATIYPPIGLVSMSSFLNENGFDSRVIDANMLRMNDEKTLDIISSESPDIIGISANIVTAKATLQLCEKIKKEFKGKKLVCGGPQPSIAPEKFLTFAGIVVRGEGEQTVLDIAKGKKLSKIDGISFNKNGVIINNKPRKLIENLDELPFPNYDLLDPNLKKYKGRAKRLPSAPILTSRGCPYQCIYCNKSIFGNIFRARSPENVLKEIEELMDKFEIKQLDILDDNFSLNPKRAEKICDMLIERDFDLIINCQNGIRADRVSRNLIHKMKLAKFFKVEIGVESGNKIILEKIKKQLDLNTVKKVVKWFREERIVVHTSFMLGLPWDTPETMQQTIDFAIELNPHIANFCITLPFPKTELYGYVKSNGTFLHNVDDGVSSGFYDMVFYETDIVKKDEVLKYYKKAYKSFYIRPAKILDILKNISSFSELKWILEAALSTVKFF